MIILEKRYTVKELNGINFFANGFVKGVVDLNREDMIPLSISITISFKVFRAVEWEY